MYRFVYESMIDFWVEIFKYLSIPDIIQISLVSKLFNNLSKSNLIWKRLCHLHPNFKLFKITDSWYETYILNYTGILIEIRTDNMAYGLKGDGKIYFGRLGGPINIYCLCKSDDDKIKFVNILKYEKTIVLVSEDNILYKCRHDWKNYISIIGIFTSGKQFLGRNVIYSVTSYFIHIHDMLIYKYIHIKNDQVIISDNDNCMGTDTIIDAWEVDGILYINYRDNKIITTNRYA